MEKGREIVKLALERAPELPGVYQMFGSKGEILYIGKAKNIKNRLKNYVSNLLSTRILNLVSNISSIEYIIAESESEALLLEARLIRANQPKYNVLLKDDKSFPYIKVRLDHNSPQILKYRGKLTKGEEFFGPFASVSDVNKVLKFLHKTFKLRNCTDSYFSVRKRPCLQYEIGMCSGPCVKKISEIEYKRSFNQALEFLRGNSSRLQKELAEQMQKYSDEMDYEKAAETRDKIKNLSYIQMESGGHLSSLSNMDIIAVIKEAGIVGIVISFYRYGHYYGHKVTFSEESEADLEEILASFISGFYQSTPTPDEIIINIPLEDTMFLEDALYQIYGSKVRISIPSKPEKERLLERAISTAYDALSTRIKQQGIKTSILQQMKDLFQLPSIPNRIEIYDNSHISGNFAVGAFVVSTPNGFNKKEYRSYNVESKIGDDYAMLREVLMRRCKRLLEDMSKKPDLIIIDGGKGQLSTAIKVISEFGLDIPLVAVAKGPDRNSGNEIFFLGNGKEIILDKKDPLKKYIQVLRDEAHRFAITTHRNKREKNIRTSSLDNIDGIGKSRKLALLSHFGSIEAIKSASIEDLCKVTGVNKALAERILDGVGKN
ncbi:MAG: excinuclease subunit [Pseudomonadota bacterium]|jgi:excinuclease ABC subunit C